MTGGLYPYYKHTVVKTVFGLIMRQSPYYHYEVKLLCLCFAMDKSTVWWVTNTNDKKMVVPSHLRLAGKAMLAHGKQYLAIID